MIAIAGGTGRLGRLVAEGLLDRGEDVRVLTREPARIPGRLVARVEARRIDLTDPRLLADALDGVRTVVSAITGFGGPGAAGAKAVDGAGNLALIDAAEAAGVRRFVLVSVARPAPDPPVGLFRAKYAAEQRLRSSGLEWTIVRPTAYMETWIDVVGRPLVASGRTRVFGRGRNPIDFVSVVDVARIVEEIVATGGFTGETVVVAGEDHTMDELVEAVERASGRTGRVDHASPAMMRLLAMVIGVLRPVLADQIRVGLLMDTADMRMSPAERLERFPSIPVTTLEDAIARELRPASVAPRPSPAPVRPG
jgi:uncharacterized protein YbjT (DUF2867 family)